MPTNGMTIDSLNTVSSLTEQDKVPVWDNESSGEPTRKITAQNFANAVKTLASLLGTGDVVNNLTSTATDKPLSAAMGKTLNDKFSNFVITDTIVMDFSTSTIVTADVPQHTGYKPICVVGTAFQGGNNPAQVTTAYLTATQVRCCSSNKASASCTVTIAYIRN